MPSASHQAKTRPPHRADVYPRTRLYRWLDQARAQYPIIWISSPPGSGKTTLASSYVAQRSLECSWYQFDTADADQAHFIRAFSETLQQGHLISEKSIPQKATTEGLPQPETHTRNSLGELIGRHGAPILVFDNCDAIPAESEIYELLCDLIADLSADSSLVFIGRNGPPQSLTRHYMNQQMSVLGWDDIRLTPEESLGIAHLAGHKARDDGSVLQVYEVASGWVAGFALMLQEMKSRRQKRAYHSHILTKSIHDYFAAEVFARENEDTRRFLMETAQMQNMTVQMAEELTGNRRAQQVLMDLCHKQQFTECREQSDPVYQYHPLFRKFLLQQADTLLHPDALAILQRRAAALLENCGQIESAALQFIRAQDWDALTQLVSRHANGMLQQGRVQTIESWLHTLPDAFRKKSPWALYWLGMCQLSHAEPASRAHFEQAYAAFTRDDNSEGRLLAWSGVIDALLSAYDHKILGKWIAKLDGLLDGREGFPTRDSERHVVTSMFCALLYHQPTRLDLGNWAERVQSCLQDCADDAHIVVMTRHLLRYQLWFGSPSACAVMMDALRIIAAAPGQPPHILIQCGLAEVFYAWFTAAYDECLKSIRKALDVALESGLYRWNFELYGLGVCASIGLGKLSDGQDWLHKMNMMLFSQPRPQAADYHYLSAWHAMTGGDLAGAHEHADTARRQYKSSGSVLYQALAEIGLAHISNERGERQKAGKYLACAQSLADEANCAHLVFLCGLVQQRLALKQDKTHHSSVSLGRTFSIGRQHAYENTYWWQPRLVSEACAEALSCDVETSYVQGLVRRHELTLDSPPLDIEHWPWLIRIYTLGRFSLLKQGQPLSASRKAQHKPLELL